MKNQKCNKKYWRITQLLRLQFVIIIKYIYIYMYIHINFENLRHPTWAPVRCKGSGYREIGQTWCFATTKICKKKNIGLSFWNKTAFGIDFWSWEVPNIKNIHFHFTAFSGLDTSKIQSNLVHNELWQPDPLNLDF